MNTPFLNNILHQVNFDRRLVYKFFVVFSLFEYALKQAGFLQAGDDLKVNWLGFAQSIHNQFYPYSTREISTAVNYLLNFPPMKQINDNGNLVFRASPQPRGFNDTQWLSVLICRVRNNLFHGGKFEYDPVRDAQLLRHTLIILENWAQCNQNVENHLRNLR
jgi:hypothetical protein